MKKRILSIMLVLTLAIGTAFGAGGGVYAYRDWDPRYWPRWVDESIIPPAEVIMHWESGGEVFRFFAHDQPMPWGGRGNVSGNLYAWGDNSYGILGDGTTVERWGAPVRVLDSVFNIQTGGGGYETYVYGELERRTMPLFAVALRTDGGLYTWGSNNADQLGDGTTTDRHRPLRIKGNVISVTANTGPLQSVFALTRYGNLYAWGDNRGGLLGDGTRISRYSPVRILDNVSEISRHGRSPSP